MTKLTGVTSFDALKTLPDGRVCTSFKDSCVQRGYFADDQDWIDTLQEAKLSAMPNAMRNLFVVIVAQNSPSNPLQLWDLFKEDMAEDYRYQRGRLAGNPRIEVDEADINEVLHDVNDMFLETSDHQKNNDTFGLPMPTAERRLFSANSSITDERSYDQQEQIRIRDASYGSMNAGQKQVYDTITPYIDRVINELHRGDPPSGGVFFLDAPGGTGKTFVFNALLAYTRSKREIALATAFSGIAALLLSGGRTFHSRCGIPIDVNPESTCNFGRSTKLGKLLLETAMIILDEAAMCDRFILEAFDRSMRALRQSDKPFGGLIVLLGGDFRQVLPVIPRAPPPQIVSRTLKRMGIWSEVVKLRLTDNMRVLRSTDFIEERLDFCKFLLDVGEETIPVAIPIRF